AEDAFRLYAQVLAKDPAHIPALLKLAERDYRVADFDAAEKRMDQALTRDDTDPRIHYLSGLIYRAAGKTTRAEDAFWSAIHFEGPQSPALAQLGEIALHEKRYDGAERLLHEALRYNPDDELTRTVLAVALRLGGKWQESRRTVAQAVAAMPLLPFALAEA